MAEVGIEPPTSRSGVRGSTTRRPKNKMIVCVDGFSPTGLKVPLKIGCLKKKQLRF